MAKRKPSSFPTSVPVDGAPGVTLGPNALCHPRRPNVGEGLCAVCAAKRPSDTALERQKINEIVELHKAVSFVEGLGKQAQAILRHHLPTYAQLHLEGAKVAASHGDTRPMEWALTHVKVPTLGAPVEPPVKTGGGETGVKVFIGVNMGGLPSGAISAEVIEIPATTDETPSKT